MVTQPGPKNPNWKGGRIIASNGYVLIKVGRDHHLADSRGYAYEHRLRAEEKLGRKLEPGEQVHHVDDTKTNNGASNLKVKESRAEHAVEHRRVGIDRQLPDEDNPQIECGCGCGQLRNKYDKWKRPAKFISGHNANRGADGRFLR
jgi:hypothetical protein